MVLHSTVHRCPSTVIQMVLHSHSEHVMPSDHQEVEPVFC